MNLLLEQLEIPQEAREWKRMIQHNDQPHLGRTARCRERGCHPIAERMSRLLVAAGARLKAWTAPSHRQVRLQLGRESMPTSVS